jgi:pimeloyl-ACP methyl ester carboxylesterase
MLVERSFDSGTVSINYAQEPGDGPLMVLLHGVTARWQYYLHVMPSFAQRWHVVAADLRGHGRSSRVGGGYGLMEYASDVIALIRHLGDGPAVLVGHSLGALISIGVASEAPELVRALVLEDPPLSTFGGPPFGVRREHPRFVATRDLLREGLPIADLRAQLASTESPGDPLAARFRAASLSLIDPEVLTWIIDNRSIENYELGERLQQIGCPTLLLQGNPELGGALTDPVAQWAVALIPDCTLVSFPKAGHGIKGDDQLAYSQKVMGFLETI